MTDISSRYDNTVRPLILYWGRRGISRLVLDLVDRAARHQNQPLPAVSISRSNELFSQFKSAPGLDLIPVDTFSDNFGALLQAGRIRSLRRALATEMNKRGITHIIDMMPHVWMPFVLPSLKRAGTRYIPVVHDAMIHPGDYRSRAVASLIGRPIKMADHVVVLSQTVADTLLASGLTTSERISVLFHPDLTFGPRSSARPRSPHTPPRLLFLGRIMPYKGLSLFMRTVEELRLSGLDVSCGVFGKGLSRRDAARLSVLGAEVVGRWLTEKEIASILSRYDVLIASHVEASQSGIVAAAHGAGLPVIATPVGGLKEQIQDGTTGLMAEAVSVNALSQAVRRLFLTPGLYRSICEGIDENADRRSTALFLDSLYATVRAVR